MAKTIGEKLRAARLRAGKSQVQVANALECGSAYVSDLENGRMGCSLERVYDFAVAIGCCPNSLDDRLVPLAWQKRQKKSV